MAINIREENFKSFFTGEISAESFEAFQDGEFRDITGLDGRDVVQQLTVLVNRKGTTTGSSRWYKKETYYLKIEQRTEDALFKITTEPTKHQPGNGFVVMSPRGENCFPDNRKPYLTINNLLKSGYGKNTSLFSQHMQDLFLNNESIARVPEITAEVYMIFLFEIARRFVETNPFGSLLKASFDRLPIAVAVAKILKLFQEDTALIFDEFFTHQGSFHIFTGSAEKRQGNIKKIHERYGKTVKNKLHDIDELTTTFGCSSEFVESGEGSNDSDEIWSDSECRSDDNSHESEDNIDINEESDEKGGSSDESHCSDEDENSVCEEKSDESEDESDKSEDESDESEQDSDATDDSKSGTSDESSGTETD